MNHQYRYWALLGLFAALVGAGGGCSSSGDSAPATTVDAPDADDADAGEPVHAGTGGPCPAETHQALGIKLTLNVNWPSTPGTMGCAQDTSCSGTIDIWLLSQLDISGLMGSGTTTMCGNQTPTLLLTQLGSEGEGIPSGGGQITLQFPSSTWDAVAVNPMKAPIQENGVFGGWNIGSSFKVGATVASFGLSPSSPLAAASATWPASESDIPASDITDDDLDGHPGITAIPSSTDGNSLPATGLATSPPYAPKADKLYVVLRTVLSFYGLSTSCTEISGQAQAIVFNDHVIGCHIQGGDDCTATQWDFVDQISTTYVGAGVTIPAGVAPPSFAPAGISGTFTAKVLSNDADGGGIQCADVLAAVP